MVVLFLFACSTWREKVDGRGSCREWSTVGCRVCAGGSRAEGRAASIGGQVGKGGLLPIGVSVFQVCGTIACVGGGRRACGHGLSREVTGGVLGHIAVVYMCSIELKRVQLEKLLWYRRRDANSNVRRRHHTRQIIGRTSVLLSPLLTSVFQSAH
jgi:hypothetical protein